MVTLLEHDVPTSTKSALERAQDLAPLLAELANEGDKQGRLTDEVSAAMLNADLFSILLPKEHGGLDGVLVDYFDTIEAIARADGAAGWCAALCNSNNSFIFKGLSEAGRQEVFGHGPAATFGALQPKGLSTPAAGGFRVSGSWSWGSGSAQARWVEVQSLFQDENGMPWMRVHVLPKTDVKLDPSSWDVMGLRATMSADYVIEDKFVPDHLVFEYPMAPEMFLTAHLAAKEKSVGTTRKPIAALSALDHAATGLSGVSAFACGVAQHALDELISIAPISKRLTGQGTQAEDSAVQAGIAEHDGKLRMARKAIRSLLVEADAVEEAGQPIGTELRIDLTQACHVLCMVARDAVIFALDNAGSSVVYSRSPLQKCLRDIFTGLKHAALSKPILARIGKHRLGLENAGL